MCGRGEETDLRESDRQDAGTTARVYRHEEQGDLSKMEVRGGIGGVGKFGFWHLCADVGGGVKLEVFHRSHVHICCVTWWWDIVWLGAGLEHVEQAVFYCMVCTV